MTLNSQIAFQIMVILRLLNVSHLRNAQSTSHRGGSAQNLEEEFAACGLPTLAFCVVGGLKIPSLPTSLAGSRL